ncbi:MAG: flagellar biosynthetic protein FliR [Spirochaetia bacterium]|nr:flagellar biosynthetic protein FliR [Spirochaetia bacterium]
MEIFVAKFQLFSLLFARIIALTSTMPALGGDGSSFFFRVALGFMTSLIVTPVVTFPPELNRLLEDSYFVVVFEQVFIGMFIGLSMQFIMAAFQMAGEFFSVQMGFGVSEVFDPLAQVSLPLMGTFKNILGLYVFFVSNAHLYAIQAVVYSFQRQPCFPEGFFIGKIVENGIYSFLIELGSGMFVIALQIALPVMGTLLLVSLTLGVLSKVAPQMNILMLGFPLKILVAYLVLTITTPIIVQTMFAQFDAYFSHLDVLLKKMSGIQ